MRTAYLALYNLGIAHSVEAWQDGRLAGGVYGVALGGYFAAESMFHTVRDASNVALVTLVEHLRTSGFELLDIQQLTPHTERLGASLIARTEFLARLRTALSTPARFTADAQSR
jgi:leucyl/phenylalanyl-tRNA--protein transferase